MSNDGFKLIAPKSRRKQLLELAHQSDGRHYAPRHMMNRLKKYTWRGMAMNADKHVTDCEKCQMSHQKEEPNPRRNNINPSYQRPQSNFDESQSNPESTLNTPGVHKTHQSKEQQNRTHHQSPEITAADTSSLRYTQQQMPTKQKPKFSGRIGPHTYEQLSSKRRPMQPDHTNVTPTFDQATANRPPRNAIERLSLKEWKMHGRFKQQERP